jgi:hypothetical protein
MIFFNCSLNKAQTGLFRCPDGTKALERSVLI